MNIPIEIIAVLIASSLALIGWVIRFYVTTHRGNKVILEKKVDATVIGKEMGKIKGLKIIYKDLPVERLKYLEYVLYNDGYKDITNLHVEIEFEPIGSPSIIEIQSDDKLGKHEFNEKNKNMVMSIDRPFLNMRRKFKNELITIQVLTDIDFNISILGGGVGWTAELAYEKDSDKRFLITMIFVLILGTLSVLLLTPEQNIMEKIKIGLNILVGLVGVLFGVVFGSIIKIYLK